MEPRIPSHSPAPDRPDAVIFGRSLFGGPGGGLSDDDMESAVEIAEHHLQCGPHELAWVRDQARYMFATRCTDDCEFFPLGHEMAGKPRYRWVFVAEDVRIGWLIDA